MVGRGKFYPTGVLRGVATSGHPAPENSLLPGTYRSRTLSWAPLRPSRERARACDVADGRFLAPADSAANEFCETIAGETDLATSVRQCSGRGYGLRDRPFVPLRR